MLIVNILLLLVFSVVLVKATDVLIGSLRALAAVTRIGVYAITSILFAVATSLPELSVGVTAALNQTPTLSLGNVIGSNIADITIVVAIGALLNGKVLILDKQVYRDVVLVFFIALIPLILLIDYRLSRVDGIVLLIVYIAYVIAILQKHHATELEEKGVFRRLLRRVTYSIIGYQREWFKLIGGVIALAISATMIVKNGVLIAQALHVPILLIGIFLVSFGTVFPETVFTIKALRKHEASMAIGDIMGSVAANATLILGIVALIHPITIRALSDYATAVVVLLVAFSVFIFFTRSKHRLDRWEGLILLLVYALFVIVEFVR